MKAKSESIINNIVLHILFGVTGSIIVGLIVFQSAIFNLQSPSFQFIAFGIVCAVFYSACIYFQPKIYIAVLLILFIFNSSISGSLITKTVIRDILYVGGIGFIVYLYLKIIKQKLISLPFGNFTVFASLITILYIANTLILSIIFISTNRKVLFMNIHLGFLVGLGVGLGLDLSEYLITKKGKSQLKKAPSNQSLQQTPIRRGR